MQEKEKQSKGYLEDMLRRGEAMHCPKCQVSLVFNCSPSHFLYLNYLNQAIITKISGCDAMLCLICRTEICWATRGPRWGPKGRGDTSGGCRCRIGGMRCHPNCGNCH